MDTYFLVNLLGDVIHAFMFASLTFLAALFLIPYYFRIKRRYAPEAPAPASGVQVPETPASPAAASEAGLSESLKITLPLRLQAYERIILYLERIQPSNLVLRLQKPEMSCQEFQLLLMRTIREEFDYNISQQVYISATAWELVKNAREESISAVNRAAAQLDQGDNSQALVRALFDVSLANEQSTISTAVSFLKAEAMELMK